MKGTAVENHCCRVTVVIILFANRHVPCSSGCSGDSKAQRQESLGGQWDRTLSAGFVGSLSHSFDKHLNEHYVPGIGWDGERWLEHREPKSEQ